MANCRKRQIKRAYMSMCLCRLRRSVRWHRQWKMFNKLNKYPVFPLKAGRMKGRTDLDGYRFTFAMIDEVHSYAYGRGDDNGC